MRLGVYAPIPMWVGGTRKWAYRDGIKPRTITIHRMEGSLEGSDSYLRREFADYAPYPRLNASTHFGVGLWNGVPQIRTWVDTAYSAFGISATPTDVPDATALRVYGDLLYRREWWPYYASKIDLNRATISVEVEGFAQDAWHPSVPSLVRQVIDACIGAHGPLTVTSHTCTSTKPCPGMATFTAAMPNFYGKTLGSVPDTSTGDPDVAILSRIYRLSPRRVTLKPNQQLYKGPGPSYGKHYLTPSSGMKVEVLGKVIDGPELYGSRIWLEMRRYSSGAKGRFFGHASTVQP